MRRVTSTASIVGEITHLAGIGDAGTVGGFTIVRAQTFHAAPSSLVDLAKWSVSATASVVEDVAHHAGVAHALTVRGIAAITLNLAADASIALGCVNADRRLATAPNIIAQRA